MDVFFGRAGGSERAGGSRMKWVLEWLVIALGLSGEALCFCGADEDECLMVALN